MKDTVLTFIGGGNMATSMIGGLLAKGFAAANIIACDPVADNLQKLQRDFAVRTSSDNCASASEAQVIVLAVKPQVMRSVCENLRAAVTHKPLIISIAAGIPITNIAQWLAQDLAIVRCMPNTPALVQLGATGLMANAATSSTQKELAHNILGAIGIVEWLDDEAQLDAVTALSGSGPAYFFLLLEAMIAAAVKQGIPQATATQLAIQTCIGAGQLAKESDVDVAELRRRVTSPGGTTQKALDSFAADNFLQSVERAMNAARDRAVAMAKEF